MPVFCINSMASFNDSLSRRIVRALSPVRRRLVVIALLGAGSFRRNSAIWSRSSRIRVSRLSQTNNTRRPRNPSSKARRRSLASVMFEISDSPRIRANSRQKASKEDEARVSSRTPSGDSLVVLAEANKYASNSACSRAKSATSRAKVVFPMPPMPSMATPQPRSPRLNASRHLSISILRPTKTLLKRGKLSGTAPDLPPPCNCANLASKLSTSWRFSSSCTLRWAGIVK